jgi:Na+/proline symporter
LRVCSLLLLLLLLLLRCWCSTNWWIAAVVSTAIPAFYCFTGGMRASLFTDVFQVGVATAAHNLNDNAVCSYVWLLHWKHEGSGMH